jgi:Flp pilus assembly protein TadD
LYLLRADAAALEEHRLLSAQDRLALLVDTGAFELAITTARAAVAASPLAPLAHSLLAYALYRAGRVEEAQAVARGALEHDMSEESRAYLRRFLELEPPSA